MGKGGFGMLAQVERMRDTANRWGDKIGALRSQRGFKKTPTGRNEFGESISGDFGVRLPKDPSQAPRIREGIAQMRDTMRREVSDIRKQVRDLRSQGRNRDADDLVEANWKQAESEVMRFRDQYRLYRGSAQQRLLDQAIRSNVYKLKTMEELAGMRSPSPRRDFDQPSTRKPGETRGRKRRTLPPGDGLFY